MLRCRIRTQAADLKNPIIPLRNDETFSAIADRTAEREACEQEVSGQKVGQRSRPRGRTCRVQYPVYVFYSITALR